MRSILITGGAGFIGSHITDALILKYPGKKIIVVDNLSSGFKLNINKKAVFYKLDVVNKKLEKIFKKENPEFVFHFSAQIDVRKSIADPLFDVDTNIKGSINVIENCKKYNVKKIIFASTGGAIYTQDLFPASEQTIEKPISPYGINKFCVDNYLRYYNQVFGLKYTSLRFANVYGPRQNSKGESGVVAVFFDKFLKNEEPTMFGNGLQTRDYIYVKDVVDACIKAMNSQKIGVYNIGSGIETSLIELIKKIKRIGGFKIKVIKGKAKDGEMQRSVLICDKAKNDFLWEPKYNLEQGLKETLDHKVRSES